MSALFIGVMSGTSLDGADAVLVDFGSRAPRNIASSSIAFPSPLRERLLMLSMPGRDSLDLMGECATELADLYASAVHRCLDEAREKPFRVRAIGCHGQTVRHRPERGFTIQVSDPARLAERTGIDVVADFRRRDVAAGGQGAPLVPAFHDFVFRKAGCHRVIVNIGGICNVTSIRPAAPVAGFDCGPGNVLMDGWIRRHQGIPFDEGGTWAARGVCDERLLESMLSEPFLALPPPKSTGRELFDLDWLVAKGADGLRPDDVQATLLEFTARAIAQAIARHYGDAEEIYLCGGGAQNGALRERIAALLAPRRLQLTDALGIPAQQVEAAAFAWLASKCVAREALDLGAITGARHPVVLGAIYPA